MFSTIVVVSPARDPPGAEGVPSDVVLDFARYTLNDRGYLIVEGTLRDYRHGAMGGLMALYGQRVSVRSFERAGLAMGLTTQVVFTGFDGLMVPDFRLFFDPVT